MATTSRPTRSEFSTGASGTPWQPRVVLAGLVGVVAMGLAVGVAELLSAFGVWVGVLSTASSPILSLGTTFIHLTPEWLKEYAIRTFGQHDKDALRVGMYVTLFVVAVLIGIVARRSPRVAAAVTVLLVLVTVAAVYTTTGAVAFDAAPILAGGALGVYLLVTVFRRSVGGQMTPATEPIGAAGNAGAAADERMAVGPQRRSGVDRRQFFRLAAIGAVVAAAAGAVSRWIPSTAEVLASRAKAVVPVPVSAQPVPAGTDFRIAGLTPYVTATDGFYRVDTAFVPPNVTAEQWSLRIHGLVDKEITIGYADLIARPQIQRMITLTCVSNPVGGDLAGNATWIGARIADLLEEAGPQSGADCVLSTSVDGFTVTTPLDALTDGRDALLAVAMNGEVLPVAHGFPVRMVVPGLYGYVSATKWVTDLKVTTFATETAYWTARGWSDHGPIKTASRIDVPRGSAPLSSGPVTIAGMAWAQHRGINKVEVRVDDGPWQTTELAGDTSADTWRQWKYVWAATPGTHTISSRATDGTGTPQTSTIRDVLPDGATGYPTRTVTVT